MVCTMTSVSWHSWASSRQAIWAARAAGWQPVQRAQLTNNMSTYIWIIYAGKKATTQRSVVFVPASLWAAVYLDVLGANKVRVQVQVWMQNATAGCKIQDVRETRGSTSQPGAKQLCWWIYQFDITGNTAALITDGLKMIKRNYRWIC